MFHRGWLWASASYCKQPTTNLQHSVMSLPNKFNHADNHNAPDNQTSSEKNLKYLACLSDRLCHGVVRVYVTNKVKNPSFVYVSEMSDVKTTAVVKTRLDISRRCVVNVLGPPWP